MEIGFQGKSVIVTGAGHGFGRAIALAFAARGAQVAACDLDQRELDETAAMAPGRIDVQVCDVTDRAAVGGFVDATLGRRGRVDVLVNNAGGVCGQVGRPLETVSPAEWQAIVAVNMTGVFYLSQAVAPAMKAAGEGRIVNISSGAGLGISKTGIQSYASAKAGQIGQIGRAHV
jgi:3-oxoacyl-[acyl-carrier protein] reductase